jgi:HEAT repeat protein
MDALADESPDVRNAAAAALGNIGDELALPGLVWMEQHHTGETQDGWVRATAARAIARIQQSQQG